MHVIKTHFQVFNFIISADATSSTKFFTCFIRRYGRKIVLIVGTLGMLIDIEKGYYAYHNYFMHPQAVECLEFFVHSQQTIFNSQFSNFSMPYLVPQHLHLHL